MKISILTLFPEMFQGPFEHSIVKHAKEKGLVEINFVNIRDFGIGRHKIVDDTSYGGGIGMVMRVDVLDAAIENTRNKSLSPEEEQVILMSASGKPFNQAKARRYAMLRHLILVCGHYEGTDDRVRHFIDEEISIGDFVVTGGELPAMLVTDAVIRLQTGVLKEGATDFESFSLLSGEQQYIEYPHFTKPQTYKDHAVPETLLSGDHQKIAAWRMQEAAKRTKAIRPDLLRKTK